MSDGSEKRLLKKFFGLYLLKQGRSHRLIHVMDLFKVVLKLLKQYRTIEQMCSDAHSITLTLSLFHIYIYKFFLSCYTMSFSVNLFCQIVTD